MSTFGSRGYHHGDLRAALFDAALEQLTAEGADEFSLRAVARRAGVSAMAPYRHYPDKEALLASLAAHGFRALHGVLHAADQEAEPGEALIAQAVAYVRFAVSNPALFRLMFGPKRLGYPELAAAGEAAYGVLSARVTNDAAHSDDADARALGCWAMVHGLAGLFLDGKVGDRIAGSGDDVTRRVAEVMFRQS